MAEIFNSVRDICSSKISIPEQVFLDVAEGRPDDNNVDLKCFALCIAKTLGFIKRSGEFDVVKFRNLTVKLVLTDEDNKEEFENAIEQCKDIRKYFYCIPYTQITNSFLKYVFRTLI